MLPRSSICSLNTRSFYSKPLRNSFFKKITDSDLSFFEKIIGESNVLKTGIEHFNVDWSKWYNGNAPCVLLPDNTEQVSAILSYCAKKRIAIVPQAGNTGLVGGSIPVHDEVVVSVKRMRHDFHFDSVTGILSCDGGFILEELNDKIRPYGYMMPFDLGSKGSCMISGNVATCAGGIRLLRYGSLHSHLLGITAVLPNKQGSVLQLGSSLRKDNTSFHIPHLFLGSEGHLGIITKVVMTTVPLPTSVQSAMLGTESFENCREILRLAKNNLGEILSSFEFMDQSIMRCLKEKLQLQNVLDSDPAFNLLIETAGSNEQHDAEKLHNFLEKCLTTGLATDGVVAKSQSDVGYMWKLRESAPLAVAKDGWVYKHDVSLPLEHFYKLSEIISKRLNGVAKRIVTYGHLGDGNSHLNVTSEVFDETLYKLLYPFLYEWVVDHGGSISAEHGIGQMKLPYAHLGRSESEIHLLKKLKKTFDPNGILNPYKMLL